MNTDMNSRDSERLVQARNWHLHGQHEQARPVYRRLMRKYPTNSDVQSLLAALMLDTGAPADALPILQRLAQARRDDADVRYNLGLAHAETGDQESAIKAYREAISRNPDHRLAWFNLGFSLKKLGRFEDAVEALRHDFDIEPRLDTTRMLVSCCTELKAFAEARRYANRCVELEGAVPDDLHRLIALENAALAEQMFIGDEQLIETLTLAEHATRLAPENARSWFNLGTTCTLTGDFDTALPALERAFRMEPGLDGVRNLLSVTLNTLGRLEEGWRIRHVPEAMDRATEEAGLPRWQGRLRGGLKLLVVWEQGIGDQILYARMLRDLADAGVEVTFVADRRLTELFRRSEPRIRVVDELDIHGMREHDAWISLGKLHIWFRPDIASLPVPDTWLIADPERRQILRSGWEQAFPDKRYFGIAWHSHAAANGAAKSIPLEHLLPVLKTPGIAWVCAQYGDGADELEALARMHGLDVIIDRSINALADLDAAAAQLSAMDAFVTVSNASAHMAGALGVTTHLLLGRRPIWHWFNEGDRSPWYRDVSIWRQPRLDSWAEPIEALAAHLRD